MHTHTNASDGLLTPSQLVEKAYSKRLDGIAITDHDSTEGINEALLKAQEFTNFLVIPGIEFGCTSNGEEVHILGYFLEHENSELLSVLQKLRKGRWERGILILEKLQELGILLPIDEIISKAKEKGFIGRATIARELLSNGFVKSFNEAFEKYLETGKPAYVERYKLTIEDTIELIHNSNGISVLAHPGLLNDKNIMQECFEKGIMGLECYHTKHSKNDEILLKSFAKRKGLIITGGSDFHGDVDILGDHITDIELIPEFKERL